MSESPARVEAALRAAGVTPLVRETPGTARTAEEAAEQIGCALDQIVKSLVFHRPDRGDAVLFLAAGGGRVDTRKAERLAEAPLERAAPALVREKTGFAIGGVAPVGHPAPLDTWLDPRLREFDTVWAAAGTPRHVFPINPGDLARITGAQIADFTA